MARVIGNKGRPEADPTAPLPDKFEEMRQKDNRKVKGRFIDNELKGGTVSFYFRKWKGDPVVKYDLTDNEEYELPVSVIKHLIDGCYQTEDSYFVDPYNNKPITVPKKRARFSFVSSEILT